jgi:hypothetical protein
VESDAARNKSIERERLWEPMFRLWTELGKPISATRKGRIYDVLSVLHAVIDGGPFLRIGAPNAETVYKAIRDFKARDRRGSVPLKKGNAAL